MPGVALLFAGLARAVHLAPGASELLEYRREAVIAGQLWRLLSCHWAHFSLDHLSWDLPAFLVRGSACEHQNRNRFIFTVLGSAVLVSVVVWFLMPGLTGYRGLSGIGSALFGLLITRLLRDAFRQGRIRALLLPASLLLLFLGKTGYELWSEASIFVSDFGAPVATVPLVQLAGAAVGMTVALVRRPGSGSETLGMTPQEYLIDYSSRQYYIY